MGRFYQQADFKDEGVRGIYSNAPVAYFPFQAVF